MAGFKGWRIGKDFKPSEWYIEKGILKIRLRANIEADNLAEIKATSVVPFSDKAFAKVTYTYRGLVYKMNNGWSIGYKIYCANDVGLVGKTPFRNPPP